LANAGEHDHKHGKRGRLQQQPQTGGLWDEARGQQRAKHRHKKIGAEANGRRALKNKPPKQPPFKPGTQSGNSRSRPAASQKTQKRVRFTLPSDEVGQIKETFEEPPDKTGRHETNKTAVIIGVVGVAVLLILASR